MKAYSTVMEDSYNPGRKTWTAVALFVLLFNLLYFRFFRPVGISDEFWKASFYLVLFASIAVASDYIFRSFKDEFAGLIKLFIGLVFISIFSARYYWGQDVFDTFISSIPYFVFLFYFFLLKSKISVQKLETIIWYFTGFFLICFYVALALAPSRLFMGFGELDQEINTSRGLARIRLTLIGAGPIYLAYFLSISRYKSTGKLKWIFIMLFLFLTIVLQLGRQAIFFSFILGVLYFLDNIAFWKKLFVAIFFSVFAWALVTYSPLVQNLVQSSESDLAMQPDGTEYIRITAYRFYMTEVSPSTFTSLFGNGQYAAGKSEYSEFIDRYGRLEGLFPADVGFASIYLFFGAAGLLLFLTLLFRVWRIKVIKEFKYAKYYISFLFLGNIAGSPLLGSIPMLCIALYILTKGNRLLNNGVNKIS